MERLELYEKTYRSLHTPFQIRIVSKLNEHISGDKIVELISETLYNENPIIQFSYETSVIKLKYLSDYIRIFSIINNQI